MSAESSFPVRTRPTADRDAAAKKYWLITPRVMGEIKERHAPIPRSAILNQ